MVHLPSNVDLNPLSLGRGRLWGSGDAFSNIRRRLCLEYFGVRDAGVILSNVML